MNPFPETNDDKTEIKSSLIGTAQESGFSSFQLLHINFIF